LQKAAGSIPYKGRFKKQLFEEMIFFLTACRGQKKRKFLLFTGSS
jgi:hypothetical protein